MLSLNHILNPPNDILSIAFHEHALIYRSSIEISSQCLNFHYQIQWLNLALIIPFNDTTLHISAPGAKQHFTIRRRSSPRWPSLSELNERYQLALVTMKQINIKIRKLLIRILVIDTIGDRISSHSMTTYRDSHCCNLVTIASENFVIYD